MEWLFLGLRYTIVSIPFVFAVLFALLGFWMVIATASRVTAGVVFHSTMLHRELIRRLYALDLLLHPSREESFGVAIAEAMALGLPLVASAGAIVTRDVPPGSVVSSLVMTVKRTVYAGEPSILDTVVEH